MKIVLLILFAYFMGFITAIPIGATQIEIVKRAIKGYIYPALMIAAASATSDFIYGIIAFFGITPFLHNKDFMSLLLMLGCVFLIVLSIFTLKKNTKQYTKKYENFLNNKKISFFVGFLLAITNPPIIFWWIAEIQLAKEFGVYQNFGAVSYVIFLLFGWLGLFSYLSIMTFFVYKLKHFISEKTEKKINFLLSIVLIIITIYFFLRFVYILKG